MATRQSEIYEGLLAGCPPIKLSRAWQFVEVHPDTRMLEADPTSTIVRLREQFSDQELLSARVALRRRNELVLNPTLRTRDRYVITVRDHHGRPCSLLTSTGDLHGNVPLFALGQDATVRNVLSANDPYFYVPASMSDVVLLRSLGLPAAPATDLERLGKRGLEHLLWLVDGFSDGPVRRQRLRTAQYEINYSGRVGPEESQPAEFCAVLVGCELVRGRSVVPAKILAAARYLAQAEQSLGISWDGLYVWWPTEEELEKLEFRRQLGDVDVVRDYFREPESLYGVSDFANPAKLPEREKSFVAVFDELVKAEKEAQTEYSQHFQERARQKTSEYYRLIDDRLFEPMVKSAFECKDLRIRPIRVQLAHVTRILQRAMPHVYAGLNESAMSSAGLIPEKACEQIQKLVNMTIQLVKAEAHIHAQESRSSNCLWPRSQRKKNV